MNNTQIAMAVTAGTVVGAAAVKVASKSFRIRKTDREITKALRVLNGDNVTAMIRDGVLVAYQVKP